MTETSDKEETTVSAESPVPSVVEMEVGALLGKTEPAPQAQTQPTAPVPGADPMPSADPSVGYQKKALFDPPFYRRLAITWGGIVLALSLSPVTPDQLHQLGDKPQHFAAYALLSFLVMRGWAGTRFLFVIFLGVLVLGAAIEGLQWFVPGRSMEMLDVLANAFGTVTGLIVAAAWISLRAKPAPRAPAPNPGTPPE